MTEIPRALQVQGPVVFGREWLVDGRVTGRTVFREAKL